MVAHINNSLDLDRLSNREFSVPYHPIPCSLKNPDIILHPDEFAKRQIDSSTSPGLGKTSPGLQRGWDRRLGGCVMDSKDSGHCGGCN